MKVAVIGAGIVGLSTANWLKRYGQDVTLFDREDPGSQASFGNAGTYAKYANIPTNSSSFFYLFPYLLLNKNSPLFIRFKRLNKTLPWILNYLYNCRNSNVNTTTNNLTKLLSKMDDGYEELFKDAGVEPYLSRKAIMYGWSTKLFFNSAKKDFSKREQTGIKIQVLSHDEISDLEPNINNIFYKGKDLFGNIEPAPLFNPSLNVFRKCISEIKKMIIKAKFKILLEIISVSKRDNKKIKRQ